MPKKTAADVYTLSGVTGGIAHGHVDPERAALEAAKAFAEPTNLMNEAARVTHETIAQLADGGQLPDDPTERRALAGQIADSALANLQVHADTKLAFHERALAIAEAMPDVHVFSGPGFTNIYVWCKADGTGWDDDHQAILDTLADPAAHKERVKQQKAADTG